MKIADIFSGGISANRNSKFNRIFNSLKWRQKYQNSELYEIELENGESFKVQQILNGEMKGLGTGTLVWPAAHVMVKYLEKRFGPMGLVGKSVCDIGTGTGITGFTASVLGASVTLTDQHHLLDFLQVNKTMAFSSIHSVSSDSVTITEYEWSDVEQMNSLKAQAFDYILVSDCVLPKLYPIDILLKVSNCFLIVYDDGIVQQAVSGIMSAHTIAIFSYEHRPFPQFDPREEFERLAHSLGLTVRVIPLAEHHEVYCAEDIEIWEVRTRSSSSGTDVSSEDRGSINSSSNNSLEVLSWGSVEEVSFRICGRPHTLQQQCSGVIGAVVWPSAVIASRFLLKTPLSVLRDLLLNKRGTTAAVVTTELPPAAAPLAVDVGKGLLLLLILQCGYCVVRCWLRSD